jgi:2-oxoglutarate dehydrogenase E2 component (dihydrolipoamide succinyltransferase)
VLSRVAAVGAKVRIGDAIARVDPKGKASVAAAEVPSPMASDSSDQPAASGITPAASAAAAANVKTEKLTPASRRMVEEHKLDASTIEPTGPGGRVTKGDVVHHLDRPAAPAGEPKAPAGDVDPGQAKAAGTTATVGADGPVRRVAMSKIRKRIAENLVRSQQTTATLTTFNEIDMSAVFEIRRKYKEPFEKAHNVGLGFMSFFARAVCQALKEWERVNASIDGEDLIYHDYVHLGIAVSTDRGLAVPILRNAHQMSFAKIEGEIKRLATATREGKLQLNELSGGTFTITNGGIFGSLMATPIINPPQSAILGMHAIKDRPVVVNGQVVVRPMMYVALSYDHRIIDGRESVGFLVRVKELLEDPQRLLLEV